MTMTEDRPMIINVDPEGTARWIHDDRLAGLMDQHTVIRRASHVEPGDPGQGRVPLKWYVDLSPVNGPTLGPFGTRRQALDTEAAWLHAHHLGIEPADGDGPGTQPDGNSHD